MNCSISIPFFATSLLFSGMVMADTAETSFSILANQNEKPIRDGSLGVEVFNAHYHIKDGSFLYKGSRNYVGLRMNVEHRLPNQYYLLFDPIAAIGQNNYSMVGIGIYEGHQLREKVDEQWLDGSLKYGYTFQPAFAQHFLLSTFIGPGYHNEKNDFGKASWYYGVGGIRMTQDLSATLTLGMDLKTMYSFSVRDRKHLTSVARMNQDTFWGLEIGLPIIWQLGSTKKFDMRLKPYFLKLNVNSIESILGSTVELGYTY